MKANHKSLLDYSGVQIVVEHYHLRERKTERVTGIMRATFRTFGKSYCSMHYINYENLNNAVLDDIKSHIMQANLNEEALLNQIQDKDSNNIKNSVIQLKNEISFNQKRIQTLDLVISKLYEDHAIGKVDDKRFRNLLKGYEEEQENLKINNEEKIKQANGIKYKYQKR